MHVTELARNCVSVVSERLPLESAASAIGSGELIVLRDAAGRLVGAVRADTVRRLAPRLPAMPVRMLPGLGWREVSGDTELSVAHQVCLSEGVEMLLVRMSGSVLVVTAEALKAAAR